MKRLIKTILFYINILLLTTVLSNADEINWKEVDKNFWVVEHQVWHNIIFSAVKFHLGYYKMNLVDVANFHKNHLAELKKFNSQTTFSLNVIEDGIKSVYLASPNRNQIEALAPAGWSRSFRYSSPSGLLIIGGIASSDYDERETLSAIFCLNSSDDRFKNYDYQVPAFYITSNAKQLEMAQECDDAVQVGPRIIEDREGVFSRRGITVDELKIRPSARVVFALDQPNRKFPSGVPNNKLRENARDGIIIVTDVDAHLYDIQEMLLSKDFCGSGVMLEWAINMAGGGPSGLLYSTIRSNSATIFGNPSGIVGSMLEITRR